MQRNLELDLKTILFSALMMFAVSMLLSFALLLFIGIVQLGATLNLQTALENTSAIGHSNGFRLAAHTIHLLVASFVGYRLANKLHIRAIPHIWIATLLAVFIHFFVHAAMGIGLSQLLTEIRFLELPVMMVFGTFIGLHFYFWRRHGVLIKA